MPERDSSGRAGDDVIVPNVLRVRGREGISAETRSALVYTVRGETITALRLFQDEAAARAAVADA